MSDQSRDTRTGSHIVATTLAQELARDDDVLVFGEDVGRLGGVFGATRRLQREFGQDRVFDTPVSETAFMGMAAGAAQSGLRPVVELMFVDFLGVCFDQIMNQIAKNTYMSGAEVTLPLVIKTAVGCIGSAAQHSQVLSGTFAHIPGLKVVLPGSPGELAGLLVAAVRDPNPVVFLEHKKLLKTRVVELPLNDAPEPEIEVEPAPLGRLRRVREGGDLTIIASGWMVQQALIAADALAVDSIEARVVDLRSIVPLDREGLIEEATTSERVLVVDEDYEMFGVTGEVIASIAEALGASAPAMTRHGLRVPIPASAVLEDAVLPSARSIEGAARAALGR